MDKFPSFFQDAIDAADDLAEDWRATVNAQAREDAYGHLIDEAGELLYDPRCYGCTTERPAQVTVVRVDYP